MWIRVWTKNIYMTTWVQCCWGTHNKEIVLRLKNEAEIFFQNLLDPIEERPGSYKPVEVVVTAQSGRHDQVISTM